MAANHVGVAGLAKGANQDQPFAVANELVCGNLAQAIRLPIPPGFIVDWEGQPYYVSLNFNLAGEDLPPADIVNLVARKADLACGIVLFDI